MTPEAFFFGLRVLSGVLLLVFMGGLGVLLWRDYRVVAESVGGRASQRGRLVVIKAAEESPLWQTTHPIFPLTSLGRAPTNTIIINDVFASSEHALITWRGSQWWLEDRGSVNGTLLNGERLQEATVVSTGDVISIGQIDLRLELD
jgi:hypothetical protein